MANRLRLCGRLTRCECSASKQTGTIDRKGSDGGHRNAQPSRFVSGRRIARHRRLPHREHRSRARWRLTEQAAADDRALVQVKKSTLPPVRRYIEPTILILPSFSKPASTAMLTYCTNGQAHIGLGHFVNKLTVLACALALVMCRVHRRLDLV